MRLEVQGVQVTGLAVSSEADRDVGCQTLDLHSITSRQVELVTATRKLPRQGPGDRRGGSQD